MSNLSTPSSQCSISESESDISIDPGSADSICILGCSSKPRRVIYESSELDDNDVHNELGLSADDINEMQNAKCTNHRLSQGSESSDLTSSHSDLVDDEMMGIEEEVVFSDFNSFVSVGTSGSEYGTPHQLRGQPLHFQQLYQQNQQLRMLQQQQKEQIQEQQQRFPRAYEAASISSTLFYQHLRSGFTPHRAILNGDKISSRALSDLDVNTQSNEAKPDVSLGTPNDPYDVLGTPPGEPPIIRPSQSVSEHNTRKSLAPNDEFHSQALQYLPRSMNSLLLLVLMAIGFGIGFAALLADPPGVYGYWLHQVGTLYIRLVNCAAVPMGICQVIFSVSTLTARGTLWRLWLKTLGLHLIICLSSVTMAIILAGAFRSSLKQTDVLSFDVSSARFGFQCSNSKYLELNGTSLVCNSDTFNDEKSTAAVFSSFVDVNAVLGLPESITRLSFTQYFLLLSARYVPNNAVQALAADHYISSMMIATVLGVAVTRSFRGGGVGHDRSDTRRNPLLRVFVHLYSALFTILDWLQSLVLIAVLPLTTGSVLVDPLNAKLGSFVGMWCLVTFIACVIQSLVLCPILFYWVTRRQPFGWLLKVMPALLYSVLLQSSLLSLPIATKSVLRSREVPSAIFGALFPVLAACNGLAQAISLPIALMWAVNYTDCGLPLDWSNSMLLFGYTMIASLGDTALPRSHIVYFLTVWLSFCGNRDLPSTPIAIGGVMLIISRLQAFTNTATNLMLVRMAASTNDARQFAMS